MDMEETASDRVFGELIGALENALDLCCRVDREGRVAEVQRLCDEVRTLSRRLGRPV